MCCTSWKLFSPWFQIHKHNSRIYTKWTMRKCANYFYLNMRACENSWIWINSAIWNTIQSIWKKSVWDLCAIVLDSDFFLVFSLQFLLLLSFAAIHLFGAGCLILCICDVALRNNKQSCCVQCEWSTQLKETNLSSASLSHLVCLSVCLW